MQRLLFLFLFIPVCSQAQLDSLPKYTIGISFTYGGALSQSGTLPLKGGAIGGVNADFVANLGKNNRHGVFYSIGYKKYTYQVNTTSALQYVPLQIPFDESDEKATITQHGMSLSLGYRLNLFATKPSAKIAGGLYIQPSATFGVNSYNKNISTTELKYFKNNSSNYVGTSFGGPIAPDIRATAGLELGWAGFKNFFPAADFSIGIERDLTPMLNAPFPSVYPSRFYTRITLFRFKN